MDMDVFDKSVKYILRRKKKIKGIKQDQQTSSAAGLFTRKMKSNGYTVLPTLVYGFHFKTIDYYLIHRLQ